MKTHPRAAFWTAVGVSLFLWACTPKRPSLPDDFIIGVKVYQQTGPYQSLFREWRALGVNTAFVSETLTREKDILKLARKHDIRVFTIFPVFYNPEILKEDPDLYAVTSEGLPARDDWVEFVCPSREGYLERRIGDMRSLLAEADPDGISLDFIRFFVFWEMIGPDHPAEFLPQTCFCPACLASFQTEMDIRIPPELERTDETAAWILKAHPDEWREWKCRVIARTVESLASEARKLMPGIRVSLHAVPWREEDFGGAVRAVAGQDLGRLAPFVDLVSPMCYHHMVGQNPTWIQEVVVDVDSRIEGPVIPSIQVSEAYVEEALGPMEFQAALEQAVEPPSKGVVFWSWEELAKSPEKQEIVRSLLLRKKRELIKKGG